MNHKKFTLFISDLHLDVSADNITRLLEHFLTHYTAKADALYILGDLFEAWLGDDDQTLFNQHIKSLLRTLTDKGLPVYFMRGNRDFLLGQRFAQETGCQQLLDPTVVTLYNTPLLLTHGDILCLQDKEHQRYRRIIQHPWVLGPGQYLPLFIRRYIGKKLRSKSQQHLRSTTPTAMDVDQNAVCQMMRQHGVSTLIHGHTHRPNSHPFKLNHIPAQRIVLASWHDSGQALRIYEDGHKEFIQGGTRQAWKVTPL